MGLPVRTHCLHFWPSNPNLNTPTDTLECGEYSGYTNILQTRIVNGELASLGEFPWQISMQRKVRAKVVQGVGQTVGNNVIELTEEEVLDSSLWGRFLWAKLAQEKNISWAQIPVNWPPPLPTHPPHHTIPPLPTHPPSHRLPTHPPFPPMPPMPTLPPLGGSRPWSPPVSQPWPPQQRPPPPPQYPPIPSLPPRPNPLPTLPPSSTTPPLPPQPKPPQQQPKPRPPIDRSQKWQHFCGGFVLVEASFWRNLHTC